MFAAILTVYYLTIPNATAQTIGLILLLGNVAGFIFEIPSGYLSDKLGHKRAIVVSRVFYLLSTLCYLFADNTSLHIFGAVFMSIGMAFLSGTGSAFMHETLRALGKDHEYTRIMGKVSSIGFAVPIVLTTLAPFLVAISYKAPFALSLVIDLIGLWAALALTTPPVTPEHIDEVTGTNFKAVMRSGYKLRFFRYALFSSLVASALFAIGIFRAPYQELLGIPVIWFGVLFGAGRGIASLLLAYSGQIKEHFSTIAAFYRFQIILYGVLMLLLVLSTNVWVITGIFIVSNGFQWGLSQVSRGFTMEIIKDSKFKATLLSVQAQLSNIIQAVAVFATGAAIATSSYPIAFLGVTLLFLATAIPLYWYIVRRS